MSADVRILDLFCGEGGAGQGYADEGWKVYGVDLDAKRLEHYPFASYCGDALEALAWLLSGGRLLFTNKDGTHISLGLEDFDAIHGSPPCTGYSRGTAALPDRLDRYDRLIPAIRDLLLATGKPYVIENVEDARRELLNPLRLCGFEFDLRATDTDGTPLHMKRHRLFESNVMLFGNGGCPGHPTTDPRQIAGAYGGARRDKVEAREVRKGGYVPASLDVLRDLLGAPWMTEKGCFLSIPPAYSRHIGAQLMAHVREVAA